MNCPKCTGLLTQEEHRAHSGLFHGWRCVQCGLRLDELILQNRTVSEPRKNHTEETSLPGETIRSSRTPRRRKRVTSRA